MVKWTGISGIRGYVFRHLILVLPMLRSPNVVKRLSNEQKDVVVDIGFSSLFQLSCNDVPVDLFMWLCDHFDCSTRTLNLPNGFSFTLNPSCVKKVLAIPNGQTPIDGKGTFESYEFFKSQIQFDGSAATVPELCSFITEDLVGNDFARVFMLLALSSFLCPNTRGVTSCRYYPALMDVSALKYLDWCSFVLDWLVSYIKKYQQLRGKKSNVTIGGCGLLLVICYLEFLCAPEVNLGQNLPRLGLWSSRTVQAVTYLDSFSDLDTSFGKLQLKHICCTPFKDCYSSGSSYVPSFEDAERYIRLNFPCSSQENVIGAVSVYYASLEQSLGENAFSASWSSVLNVLHSICSSQNQTCKKSLTYLQDTDSDDEGTDFSIHKRKVVPKPSKLSTELYEDLIKFYPKFPPVPPLSDYNAPEVSCSLIFHRLLSQYIQESESFSDESRSQTSEFESPSFSIEDCISQVFGKITLNETLAEQEIDLIKLAAGDPIPKKSITDQYVDVQMIESLMKSFEDLPKAVSVRNEDSCQHTSIGASNLQSSKELMLPAASQPIFHHDVISYHGQNNPDTDIPDTLMKGMQKDFKYCRDLLDEEAVMIASRRKQAILTATTVEINFFQFFTSNIDRSKQSIKVFQIGPTYVDHYKLSLSMMVGGWTHYHVMNSFLKMLGCQQDSIVNLEGHVYQQYIDSQTSALLMQSSLDHTKYKQNFLEIVGFRLYRAGLLHIPCFVRNQWFLVVVNFLNESFDVLDSEKNPAQTSSLAYTVINNFKVFFQNAFPRSLSYDITKFSVRFITVPKHNFRYDSGVFVIQFIMTYNGSNVEPFSNADLLVLHSKFLFQLLRSKYNEIEPPVLYNFLQQHGNNT
ncbi:hypothetical protein EJB05_09424 [Eragrostis curvula]|uniref:Ubiquitin-like protease family profile domain-containing protein n=1 Tax=Eragrostis curvula TaxID=38414 RepID=A0A5J9W4Z2_9POAL|nr:hypothetical protein EJB05_09424 [Eragrostis curvula]